MAEQRRVPSGELELAAEVEALETAIAKKLDELPSPLRGVAEEIPHRIDQGLGDHGRWVERFSLVTLLYPLLHSEGLTAIDREAARDCCVAQTLLVIHAFLDDRQLDDQLVLSREERLFDRWLVAEALHILQQSVPEPHTVVAAFTSLQAAYLKAQTWSYAMPPPGFEPASAWPAAATAGRAALGLVPTLALAVASGCTESEAQRIEGAFGDLALGLQWMDDLEDWKDDRRGRRENLLLHRLAVLLAAEGAPPPGSERETGTELIRRGVVSRAMSDGKRAFECAKETAYGLGCKTLNGLIQRKIAKVETMQSSLAEAQLAVLSNALVGRSAPES